MIKRQIANSVKNDLKKKIVLLSGPRQCGKTTLAKQLDLNSDYFNYDLDEDRIDLRNKSWNRKKELVIFDELHKMKSWKRWLKGIYDTEGNCPAVLVTGSAKLDLVKKTGDSLAGRFFQHRLYPFDIKELAAVGEKTSESVVDRLLSVGGFPEPFINADHTFYRRWRSSHTDIILRQDLIDFSSARDIRSIETLIALLRRCVGSSVSYSSLARDLERDPNTIRRWLDLLESLYVIFRVTPYHRNVARSILKEPKFYFYDTGQIDEENQGAKLENLVALSLLKELHRIQDQMGQSVGLHYVKNKEKAEIDFLVVINNKPTALIDVKHSDASPNSAFKKFAPYFPGVKKIQLVRKLSREKTYPDDTEIRRLTDWLIGFEF